jgi:hypothetical protein
MKRLALGIVGLFALGWIGWQDIPGEFLQRPRTFVTDYGAIPNDGLDDSDAIIRCRNAAIANGTYWVHFPAGTYTIEKNNVLHPLLQTDGTYASSATRPAFGIKFSGDAQNYTILQLSDESEVHWFYDADPTDGGGPGWNRWQIEHLYFKGSGTTPLTAQSNTNGFRLFATTASGGVDKGLIAHMCRFDYLGIPRSFGGTSNSESCNFYSCWWSGCGPTLWKDDDALCITDINCHYYYSGDLFWVQAASSGNGGGGAAINILNGDFVSEVVTWEIDGAVSDGSGANEVRITTATAHGLVDGDAVYVRGVSGVTVANDYWASVDVISSTTFDLTGSTFSGTYSATASDRVGKATPYYMVRIDDAASFYRILNITGGQAEMRGPQSRLVHWDGTGNPITNSHVGFTDTNLSIAQTTTGLDEDNRRYLWKIGPNKRVVHTRCYFPQAMAIEFDDVNTSSVTAFSYQPTIEFRNCGIPSTFLSGTNDAGDATDATRGLTGRISLSNGYGRATATDCFLQDVGIERMAVDFDYNADAAVRGEPQRRRNRVQIKPSPQLWPYTSGGVGVQEKTILLPENSRITAVGFSKPTSSTAVTEIRYRMGPDDKSTFWCQSPLYRADGLHESIANESNAPGLFPIDVGSDLNLRRVRLWMPVEHSPSVTGGTAWVEYE